jgi:hypothetical protein
MIITAMIILFTIDVLVKIDKFTETGAEALPDVSIIIIVESLVAEIHLRGSVAVVEIAKCRHGSIIREHEPELLPLVTYHGDDGIPSTVIQTADQLLLPISRNVIVGVHTDREFRSLGLYTEICGRTDDPLVVQFHHRIGKCNIPWREPVIISRRTGEECLFRLIHMMHGNTGMHVDIIRWEPGIVQAYLHIKIGDVVCVEILTRRQSRFKEFSVPLVVKSELGHIHPFV